MYLVYVWTTTTTTKFSMFTFIESTDIYQLTGGRQLTTVNLSTTVYGLVAVTKNCERPTSAHLLLMLDCPNNFKFKCVRIVYFCQFIQEIPV